MMDQVEPDDHALLHAYAAGNESAFAVVVERHRGLVWSLARALTDAHAAEDVCQAVFLLLSRQAVRVAGRNGPVADWLLACTRRIAANHRRSETRRRRRERNTAPPPDSSPSELPTDLLLVAIDQLPAGLRHAVVLHHLEGLDRPVVAERLGVTPAALDKRLQRALDTLRAAFAKHGFAGALASVLAAVGLATRAEAAPSTQLITAGIAAPSTHVTALCSGGTPMSLLMIPTGALLVAALTYGLSLVNPAGSVIALEAEPPVVAPALDQNPGAVGDAATHLYRAALLLAERPVSDDETTALTAWKSGNLTEWAVQTFADPNVLNATWHSQVFEELTLASAAPNCDWKRQFLAFGPNLLLPELQHFRRGSELLLLRAACHAKVGNRELARRDLVAAVALGRHIQRDVLLLSRTYGFNIEERAWRNILYHSQTWAAAERTLLGDALAALPAAPPLSHVIIGERGFADWLETLLAVQDIGQIRIVLMNVGLEGSDLLAANPDQLKAKLKTKLKELRDFYLAYATALDLPPGKARADLIKLSEQKNHANDLIKLLTPSVVACLDRPMMVAGLAEVVVAQLRAEPAPASAPAAEVVDGELVLTWPELGLTWRAGRGIRLLQVQQQGPRALELVPGEMAGAG